MDTATQILVIIVSVLLSLTLIVGLVLLVFILKVVKSLKHIADRAEGLIDSAEAVTDAFRNVSGPLAMFKMVQNIVSLVNEHKRKGRK